MSALDVKVAAARAAGALSRRTGRGGTSLPGKLLMRLEPHAIGAPGRAAGARQRRDLGHQRQDDDRRDGRRASSSAPARTSSTTAPGRTWPAAWRPPSWPARPTATPASSRSTSSGSARSSTSCSRARCCWPTCSATSSTATASSTRSPTAGRPWWRAPRPRSSSTPTTRRSPTSAAHARRRRRAPRRTSASQDDAMALPADAARRRRQALPALRRALPLRRRLPGPPRPLPLRQLRRDAPRPAGLGPRHRARGRARRALHAAHAGRASGRSRCPLPGLYNVYNALGAAALALALGATLDHVDAGLHAVSPAFGRAETLRIAERELSILLVKNPAGANEVLRTLTLEDGEHDVFAALNDNIADGRDVSWVWDADFEVLAPRVRRATCSGTRAAEMALRLKYAGVPTDRIAVEPDLGAGLDRALRAGRRAALRPAHLHRDARAARPARRARRRAGVLQ